jgi:hypothetical protein
MDNDCAFNSENIITIGSDKKCDVKLPAPCLPMHCCIIFTLDEGWQIVEDPS